MRYKLLGRSGVRVSELCLGTMTFGSDWGWGADREDSRKQFEMYVKAGGNFIDTANKYTDGTSEKFVGEFIKADRDRFVVATKYTLSKNDDDPNANGNHRKNMVQALEKSLKRLDTDYIDLYWVHAWDYTTPEDEVMRGLDDLVRSGKVLYVGISDAPAWVVSRLNTLADLRGWSPFVGLQIEYSLIERTVERELIPMARALDLAVAAWGPLGGGVLTGKYTTSGSGDARRGEMNAGRITDRNLTIAEETVKVARELGRSPAQVAINWVRQQTRDFAAPVIPILGARTTDQLADNLGALEFTIPDPLLRGLNKASQVPLGFPHDFLSQPPLRKIVFGDHDDDIDNHRL